MNPARTSPTRTFRSGFLPYFGRWGPHDQGRRRLFRFAGGRGEALPGGTIDEQIAYEKGRNAALGIGGVNLLMILAFGPVILTVLACFWPLVGIVTYGNFVFTKDYFIAHFPGHGIVTMFASFGAGGAALYLMIKAERWLEQFPIYLIVRRAARLVALMIFYVYFTLTFFGPRYIPDKIALQWIDQQLTIRDYIAMIGFSSWGISCPGKWTEVSST